MAQIVWTQPALAALDAIADYIALDHPEAAQRLVRRVFSAVEQLERFPASGSRVPELPKSVYRQLIVSPCRIFYRPEGNHLFITCVMRAERLFRKEFLD